MAKKRLEELLAFIETTDLQEVVWEKKDTLISFRRAAGNTVVASKSSAAAPAKAPASGIPAVAAKTNDSHIIKSTMVGTFYRSDSPNRPPMVVEGTVVESGQPVAAIEAMKIMKDVVAPVSCKIVKALVANGHPVEYGQPLFLLDRG